MGHLIDITLVGRNAHVDMKNKVIEILLYFVDIKFLAYYWEKLTIDNDGDAEQ